MFSFMDSLQNLHAELVYFKIVYSGHREVASKLVKELVLNLFHRLRYERNGLLFLAGEIYIFFRSLPSMSS